MILAWMELAEKVHETTRNRTFECALRATDMDIYQGVYVDLPIEDAIDSKDVQDAVDLALEQQ